MREFRENEKQAIDYLLGAMTTDVRDTFEERLFIDENLSFTVEAIEKDLIDEYLRDELNFHEKQKFENNFLTTASRREKLRVAEILNRKLFGEKEIIVVSAPTSWEKVRKLFSFPNLALAGSAAAIVVLLILAGIWLLSRNDNQRLAAGSNQNGNIENSKDPAPIIQPTVKSSDNSNVDANTVTPANSSNINANSNKKSLPNVNRQKESKPDNSPKQENPQPGGSSIFAFTLFPATRSGENPELIIAPRTETINLRVVHNNEEKFVKYRAEIRNSDGATIWAREVSSKAKSRSLNFALNSKLFKPDLYELALLGITPAGEYEETNFYNFTVKKK